MCCGHKFTATDKLVKIDDKEIYAYGYEVERNIDSIPLITIKFYANEIDIKDEIS